MKMAIAYGANSIQLDYIRYNTKQPARSSNAQDILKVIQWFKARTDAAHIPLEADVFGIASFGESKSIGQNMVLFAPSLDAICPMVYPSHFDPYLAHAVTPYQTILNALNNIRLQFKGNIPIKIYAYLEMSNYRYPLSGEKRTAYIQAQINAVEDAEIDGWYFWSARNKYEYLFNLLSNKQTKLGNALGQTETIVPSAKISLPAILTKLSPQEPPMQSLSLPDIISL